MLIYGQKCQFPIKMQILRGIDSFGKFSCPFWKKMTICFRSADFFSLCVLH